MYTTQPWHITAADLAAAGKWFDTPRLHNAGGATHQPLPREMTPSCSLVYSSPGTLSYNSPGALGWGVKRAALVIPQSVMLLVAPDCCGRNSTILSENEGYASRMFYLRMTESDLITGDHLKRIGQAIVEICRTCDPTPRVVVVCVTCVDALLGTDVERVCRQAEEIVNRSLSVPPSGSLNSEPNRSSSVFLPLSCATTETKKCIETTTSAAPGVRVIPSYMYALTREGTRPPMTAIRDTIYSLLERLPVASDSVNLLGFFAPVSPRSELFAVLHSMGINTVRQVSGCRTLEEYAEMGEANFNIVLNGEAVYAAERLKQRLGMPYVELTRLYDTGRIAKQYRLFTAAVGATVDEALLGECKARADKAVARFTNLSLTTHHLPLSFAIGQMISASPFELAVSLVRYGFAVPVIIATPADTDWPWVKQLAAVSPDTQIYPPTHPSMALSGSSMSGSPSSEAYRGVAATCDATLDIEAPVGLQFKTSSLRRVNVSRRPQSPVTIAVGKDAAGLFPGTAAVEWMGEEEPFGFQAVTEFFDKCSAALEGAQ